MTYDDAIKIIWPDATVQTGTYHNGEPWATMSIKSMSREITFDALLAVWRERLDGWCWDKTQDDIIECGDRVGAADTFTISAYPKKNAGYVEVEGCADPLQSFTILTALALQAKEPKS